MVPVSAALPPKSVKNLHCNSALGHIYMEIDPVYSRLDPADIAHSDHQLSDVSDDDLRRCSDISRQSSNRYAEERPLIRNTIRKSVPPSGVPPRVQTLSARCGSSLRMNPKTWGPVTSDGHPPQQQGFHKLDTPITIALSPGGDQFVSLNLDQHQQPVERNHVHSVMGHHLSKN